MIGDALLGVDQDRPHLSGTDIGHEVAEPEEPDRRHAGQHVGHGVAAALERNAHHVGAGPLLPVFHEQTSDDDGAEYDSVPAFSLRIGRQLVEALHGKLGADAQRLGDEEQVGDRLEALDRIVGQALLGELVVGERLARHHAERVAVGRGLRAGARAEDHEAAGVVLNHDRLAQPLVQRLRQAPARTRRCSAVCACYMWLYSFL